MFKSNSIYYIKSTIPSTATVGGTFLLSTDVELNQNLDTDGDTVSMVLKNGTQIERFEVTAVGGTGTIVKRGITQSGEDSVSDPALRRQWQDGTLAYITALAFDLVDNQNAKPLRITIPKVADVTARNALYPTPTGGELVRVTSLGGATQEYNSSTAQWESFDIGTPTPFASSTVSGTMEIGTQAQINAVTDTGETGALLAVIPSTLDAKVFKQSSLVNSGITGEGKLWFTATPPTNWLICNGASLLRTDYAPLFAVIGTTYGAADGTHFNLPDFRGRSPIGSGTGTATRATAHALGATPTTGNGGEETHILSVAELAAHTHTLAFSNNTSGTFLSSPHTGFTQTGTDTTSSAGTGDPHNIMSPNVAINFIIRI